MVSVWYMTSYTPGVSRFNMVENTWAPMNCWLVGKCFTRRNHGQNQPGDGMLSHTGQNQPGDGILSLTSQTHPDDGILSLTSQTHPDDGMLFHTSKTQPDDGMLSHTGQNQPGDGILSLTSQTQPDDGMLSNTSQTQPGDGTLSNTSQNQSGDGTLIHGDPPMLNAPHQYCSRAYYHRQGLLAAKNTIRDNVREKMVSQSEGDGPLLSMKRSSLTGSLQHNIKCIERELLLMRNVLVHCSFFYIITLK